MLNKLKISFAQQVTIGVYSVDFLLKGEGQDGNFILEMMGHQHYARKNEPHSFNMGRRIYLESKGYKYLYIMTADWKFSTLQQ